MDFKPDQVKKSTKIEQGEVIFDSDPDPFFEGYFDEVRKRQFIPRTDADIEKAVSLELSAPPITPLTEDELQRLREYLTRDLEVQKERVNEMYRKFVEQPIYLVDGNLVEQEKLKKKITQIH